MSGILELDVSEFKANNNSPILSAGIAIAHIASGLVAGALGYLAFTYNIVLGAVLYLPLVFFIGTRWRAINNMCHECFHFHFVRKKSWNERYGIIFAILEFGSYYEFREDHATHHRHLGDFDKDQDFRGFEEFDFPASITLQRVLKQLLFAMSLRHISVYISAKMYVRRDPPWARWVRTIYILALLTLAVLYPLLFVAYVLVPFITSYQIIKYLTDYLDHGGLLNNTAPLHQSRNCLINNPLLRWIAFPRHDNYHLVHHLFPAIPNSRMHEAHQWLCAHWPEYANLEHNLYKKMLKLTSPHV